MKLLRYIFFILGKFTFYMRIFKYLIYSFLFNDISYVSFFSLLFIEYLNNKEFSEQVIDNQVKKINNQLHNYFLISLCSIIIIGVYFIFVIANQPDKIETISSPVLQCEIKFNQIIDRIIFKKEYLMLKS